MTVQTLLEELRKRNIWVWADGNRLQCSTPAGVPQAEVSDLLRQRKDEILEYLRGPAELSFAQQRLWFLDQVNPGGAAYIIAQTLELRGALDARVLERALGALVSRHESLRTVFVHVEGQPLQVISEPGVWTLPVEELNGEADKDQRLREDASRGFDLARGPLFRAQLFRLAPDTHVLLLAMHHIVSDGWSMGVLMRELGELYGRFSRGESTLPALRLQYRDFARWQRSWLQGEALEGMLAHWRARLAGAPQVLELPTDRPRPAVESFRGTLYSFTLPLELTDALRGLSRREGATLFMTLLAGFTLLLSRYSGQKDLLVGTPVANRNRAEIEELVGFFVNTLVLRADLSGEPSVREFLGRMREVCLDAYAHQDLPFERLVEELRPARGMSRNPLFQVMFALQNAPGQALELPGLTLSPPVEVDVGTAKFDLSLHMWETADGLRGYFEYATDLFDESTIARMKDHWRTLLEAMVATPERRIDELPLLTEAERNQLVVEWNQTGVDYPRDRRVDELFEEQAQRTPERVAVVFEEQRLTYRELNAHANRLARHLHSLGVGPDVLVGLYLERSVDMVVGLLGILKAGGAYVPLDPAYPAERLAVMLEDAQPLALLTQVRLQGQLPPHQAQVVCLDALPASRAHAKGGRSANDKRQASDLAYVLYTSGSTGKPKGVAMHHGPVGNLISWQIRNSVLARAKTLQFASLNFDVSFQEIFSTLCCGGTLAIASQRMRQDPVELLRYLNDETVERLFLPFVALQQLAEAAQARGVIPLSLRDVITAGEQLRISPQIRWLFDQISECRLHNQYGPTETHVATSSLLSGPAQQWPALPSIGRPISNAQIFLLDRYLQPVPVAVAGELYIGGEVVARGYQRRPELTSERFIANPFSTTDGARLYKTGDLARYLPDGNIEFLGRNDDQVKIRGYRIELGEIEAVLAEHPDVRQAAVHLWRVKANDVRMVACCVPVKAGVLAPVSLRKYLRARLPEYMIPQHFLPLDEIPLTPSGKLDRLRLPIPVAPESPIGPQEAPADAVEAAIAEIWTQLIQPARAIGRNDKFFEMGGHSLLAIRALRQMEQKLGVKLDFQVLLQESLAEIATQIRSRRLPEQKKRTARKNVT